MTPPYLPSHSALTLTYPNHKYPIHPLVHSFSDLEMNLGFFWNGDSRDISSNLSYCGRVGFRFVAAYKDRYLGKFAGGVRSEMDRQFICR
ncbi:hypothetical protein B0H34DRAFT_724971 [Crassisporium funariophilum]|nr:hypothetical protein B0H34DRAFT_724971 [Crassisporium funariophilum]